MFFPKKFTVSYIKQAYQNGEFTPTELIEEIIKRSEKYSCLLYTSPSPRD